MQNRYDRIFPGTIAASILLMLLGVALDDPANILPGLYHIVTMQDLLITDYVHIAGVGATLINSGLVMILSILIIKLSGEALADSKDGSIFDREKLERIANVVKEIHEAGVEIGIVVGAGNIWRGRMADKIGIEQAQADYMGMLGTIMNGMAIQNALELKGLSTRVMSAINVPQCCEPYIRRKAMSHLSEGRIVIFAGGTGNPYFTTDSCATLRALEVKADAILMAKNGVDGVFDSDPRKNPNAKLLADLTYHEVVERKLAVMDLTAVAMLEGKDVVVRVFNMDHPSSFLQVLSGETIGTVLHKDR